MSEDYIVRHCAPTLAGLKTGSIFTCPYESKDALICSVRQFNQKLGRKGLRMLPLRFSDKKALIYLYRPSRLSRDLSDQTAREILHHQGYDSRDCHGCVIQLIQRLQESDAFPHEIGLFLGYPPEDVWGFMKDGPCCCKCTGCWKVYGDVEAAEKKFAQYKKCSRIYWERFSQGRTVEHLAVSG